MKTRLHLFNPCKGLDRGRPKAVEMMWYLLKCALFLSALPWPSGLKVAVLRKFGAKVGAGVVIKPRVNIHFPWKLEIGDYSWLGEEVFILNFEPVRIGANCCISQRAFLCTGNHDFRDEAFSYRNAPITVADGAWVGASVFVGPGAKIGVESVVSAGSVVTGDLPAGKICAGNPAIPKGDRWKNPA